MDCFGKGSLTRRLLLFYNLIFILIGVVLVVVGGLQVTDTNGLSKVLDELDIGIKAPEVVLVALGSVIFLFSFYGSWAAQKNSTPMLKAYASCLALIFITQIVIGCYAIVNFKEVDEEETLYDIFNHPSDLNKEIFDSLQSILECCGVKSVDDYDHKLMQIPKSCCMFNDCTKCGFWPEGCAGALNDWTMRSAKTLGGVALGLSIVEVIGISLAYIQANAKTKEYSK